MTKGLGVRFGWRSTRGRKRGGLWRKVRFNFGVSLFEHAARELGMEAGRKWGEMTPCFHGA
jgi:hypothetical protein